MWESRYVKVAACGSCSVWGSCGLEEFRRGGVEVGEVAGWDSHSVGGVAVWGEVTVCKESRCGGFIHPSPLAGILTPLTGSPTPLADSLNPLAGPQTIMAGSKIPLAGPLTLQTGPQTP